jgi:hypothetical protein
MWGDGHRGTSHPDTRDTIHRATRTQDTIHQVTRTQDTIHQATRTQDTIHQVTRTQDTIQVTRTQDTIHKVTRTQATRTQVLDDRRTRCRLPPSPPSPADRAARERAADRVADVRCCQRRIRRPCRTILVL